jgi:branched-chain amino acid transport system permease protein
VHVVLPLAFDKDLFVQLCVNGLTAGSLYALIALGFSMVYGILKLLNFAHGDVLMIGAFVGYFTLTTGLNGPTALSVNIAVALILVFVVAMLASGFLGVAIERFAYRPLRNAPRIAPLISALGVAFFLQNSSLLLFGADFRTYSSFELDNGVLFSKGINTGPLHLPLLNIICIGTAIGLMVLLTLLVRYTRLGKAMRATAFDREAAAMMGIDPDRVIVATFFIGSALAGAAGVMFGLLYGQVYHLMGLLAGLKGFIAAVVGGIGSIPGAMLGGLLIGFAEAFAAGYLPQGSTFQNVYVFLILIVVLLVRPQGLLGRPDIQKV